MNSAAAPVLTPGFASLFCHHIPPWYWPNISRTLVRMRSVRACSRYSFCSRARLPSVCDMFSDTMELVIMGFNMSTITACTYRERTRSVNHGGLAVPHIQKSWMSPPRSYPHLARSAIAVGISLATMKNDWRKGPPNASSWSPSPELSSPVKSNTWLEPSPNTIGSSFGCSSIHATSSTSLSLSKISSSKSAAYLLCLTSSANGSGPTPRGLLGSSGSSSSSFP